MGKVGKRKRPNKKKISAQPHLSAKEEALINDLLADPENTTPERIKKEIKDARLALALTERVPTNTSKDIFIILEIDKIFEQQIIKKAVKKAIYKLRQNGISVPELESQKETPSILRKPPESKPEAYLGPIDRAGNRGLFFSLPRIGREFQVGMGIVNDEEGILEFFSNVVGKRQMKESKGLFFDNFKHAVETNIAHACSVLESAFQKNKENSSDVYARIRSYVLEKVSLSEAPVIYEFVSPDKLNGQDLAKHHIDRLFEHQLIFDWIIDPKKIEHIVEKIQKIKESPIVLTEFQKLQQINEIKEKFIAEFFNDSRRLTLKNRLEEMAYVFYKLDEEECVYLSLLAANSLDDKDSIFSVNPFPITYLERSLDFIMKENEASYGPQDDEDFASSNIIVP